jgi:hypothetical protein
MIHSSPLKKGEPYEQKKDNHPLKKELKITMTKVMGYGIVVQGAYLFLEN